MSAVCHWRGYTDRLTDKQIALLEEMERRHAEELLLLAQMGAVYA